MNSVSAVSAPLSLARITDAFLRRRRQRRCLFHRIWYAGTNCSSLGTVRRARQWVRVVNVPLPGPHAPLTPDERQDVQRVVLGLLGLGFSCRAMIDRADATLLRIEVRLHRRVTRSQATLDSFFDNAEQLDRIAKGATPAFAFIPPAEFGGSGQPG
jgi:hypothetical protein